MKSILVFLICILPAFLASAQNITLSGKVQDQASQEPLPFASVGLKGRAIGTVTNLQGEFDFHFSNEYRNDILVISMLGYQNFEAPVWSLLDGTVKVLQMSKSTTLLKEVVVADSLRAGEIVRIALDRIEDNYPMQPFILDGFYRDIKKVGGTHIALLEAAVKVYDENYLEPRNKSKLRERVKLVEVRKSVGYDSKFTPYFGQQNLLEDLLLHNNVRYHQIDLNADLFKGLTREPNSFYNGHDVYVLTYSNDFFLKIFIDKEDYSIIHLEYETSVSGKRLAKKKNVVSKHISHHHSIDFKKYNGKMYLNYITVKTKEDWHSSDTDSLNFQTELIQSFLVNAIHPHGQEEISSTEKMRNYGLQYQDYQYNKEFWDNYNVIKETPLDKQIVQDLEKLAPLENQFQQNE